jgi:hypothetical protein
VFTLLAGPLAWFAQLNVGYVLVSTPCFHVDQRLPMPVASLAWTRSGADLLVGICAAIAVAGFAVSWRTFRQGRRRSSEGREALPRDQFIAVWGAFLCAGFGIATLFTAAGLLLLPRCGG